MMSIIKGSMIFIVDPLINLIDKMCDIKNKRVIISIYFLYYKFKNYTLYL